MIRHTIRLWQSIMLVLACIMFAGETSAQFVDDFTSFTADPTGANGWSFNTGDGTATMDFRQGEDGYASIFVDATSDQRNIWWALIRQQVSANFNLSRMSDPDIEFRIEARIRSSHAPRRVNLHLNTQRTTDFHSHLMEFDIPDTTNWHTISMTTRDFDARPGDQVNGQMALMDWGLGNFRVDIDYFKVDIVDRNTIGPDVGMQLPYRPPIPAVETFEHHITAAQDGMIDTVYRDMNFNDWSAQESDGVNLLGVNGSQFIIMRWDLDDLAGRKAVGAGLLELTTWSVQLPAAEIKDFGMVRVVEILGGDPQWSQNDVTYAGLCNGEPLTRVFNTQMIIDVDVAKGRGAKNLITITNPVLQRMIDGRTLGLAIIPLGAINASYYALEFQRGENAPRLHLNVE